MSPPIKTIEPPNRSRRDLLAASARAAALGGRRWPGVDQFRHALACCFVGQAADAAAEVVEHVLRLARSRTGDRASTVAQKRSR